MSGPRAVDLGVGPGLVWDEGRPRVAVVLPGVQYRVGFPLLWFARRVALNRGYTVLEILDAPGDREEPRRCVETRAEAALAWASPQAVVLVAKSLSTLAAPFAADRGLPAVWLTPLLGHPDVVEGLRRAAAPALLVGGTADPCWDSKTAASLNAEVLELEGADHSIEVGDPLRSVDLLRRVTEAVDSFLGHV